MDFDYWEYYNNVEVPNSVLLDDGSYSGEVEKNVASGGDKVLDYFAMFILAAMILFMLIWWIIDKIKDRKYFR